MLSQAEHDELAAALCVTTSLATARKIQQAVEIRLKSSKRQAITLQSLKKYGAIHRHSAEKRKWSSWPTRLRLSTSSCWCASRASWRARFATLARSFSALIRRRRWAIILPGPNHVLPTGGSARFFSPLGTYDFLKRTTLIHAEKRALKALAPSIIHLARLEGLDDHARAVEARFAASY
jgi:histidinol dehydrogenase